MRDTIDEFGLYQFDLTERVKCDDGRISNCIKQTIRLFHIVATMIFLRYHIQPIDAHYIVSLAFYWQIHEVYYSFHLYYFPFNLLWLRTLFLKRCCQSVRFFVFFFPIYFSFVVFNHLFSYSFVYTNWIRWTAYIRISSRASLNVIVIHWLHQIHRCHRWCRRRYMFTSHDLQHRPLSKKRAKCSA